MYIHSNTKFSPFMKMRGGMLNFRMDYSRFNNHLIKDFPVKEIENVIFSSDSVKERTIRKPERYHIVDEPFSESEDIGKFCEDVVEYVKTHGYGELFTKEGVEIHQSDSFKSRTDRSVLNIPLNTPTTDGRLNRKLQPFIDDISYFAFKQGYDLIVSTLREGLLSILFESSFILPVYGFEPSRLEECAVPYNLTLMLDSEDTERCSLENGLADERLESMRRDGGRVYLFDCEDYSRSNDFYSKLFPDSKLSTYARKPYVTVHPSLSVNSDLTIFKVKDIGVSSDGMYYTFDGIPKEAITKFSEIDIYEY